MRGHEDGKEGDQGARSLECSLVTAIQRGPSSTASV